MNIDKLKQYVENVIGQYQTGFRWRPDDIGPDADAASLDFLSSILGLPETLERDISGKLSTSIPANHKRSSRYMASLKVPSSRINSTSNIFPFPENFLFDEEVRVVIQISIDNDEERRRMDNCGYGGQIIEKNGVPKYVVYEIPVREVDRDKIGNILNSKRHRPTINFPKMVVEGDSFKVYPRTVKSIVLDYIKVPTVPVWGFTTQNGAPVYDPATSTDLDWPDDLRTEIGNRIIRRIGIKLRDQFLAQYGQVTINDGE